MIELYIIGSIGVLLAAGLAHTAVKVVWRKTFRAKVKGHKGEAKVRRILKKFSKKDSPCKNDILIPGSHGTTQIDHLLISNHGLFVIETKNYAGTVYGGEFESTWKHYPPGGNGTPRNFMNPISQNKGHIRAIQKLLPEYKDIPIYSIVLFPGKTDFPNLPGVFSFEQLKGAIKFLSGGSPVLSSEQVAEISSIIDNNTIRDRGSRSMHNLKASLAAEGNNPQEIDVLIQNSVENASYVRPVVLEAPNFSLDENSEFALLTDTRATLKIQGHTKSIDGFFEAAKRREDGQPIQPGGNFDYFICPYTGDKFPPSEAVNLYRGLWISYLNKNPNLVAYMKEHGTDNLGNSFRCRKTLSLYNDDKEQFTAEVRDTAWYRNMVQKYALKKPLNQQINGASVRSGTACTSKTRSQALEAR